MNRRQEYDELMRELERPAAVDAVARARRRLRRRRMWTYPALGLAAAAMAFVMLVNFCAPVAVACADVPVLKELARLVSFSSSMTDQLNHGGAQRVEQTQEANGVSVYVDSVIVDQKRLTVFYQIDAEPAERAVIWYSFRDDDGYIDPIIDHVDWEENEWDVLNGQMRSVTFDFGDADVPKEMNLQFSICTRLKDGRPLRKADDVHDGEVFDQLGGFEAQLRFHIVIDSRRLVRGYERALDRELVLDGQRYTLSQVNIYSSKAEIELRGRASNTAWLEGMDFHLECEDGTVIRHNGQGILWKGDPRGAERRYYCESPFYHMPSGKVKLVITGAAWLDKDQRKGGVNLKTGELTDMPECIEFGGVRQEDGRTVLRLHVRQSELDRHGIFEGGYAIVREENEPVKNWVDISWGRWVEDGRELGRYYDFVLNPYDLVGDWIYFPLICNRYWQPEEPVVVELSMVD